LDNGQTIPLNQVATIQYKLEQPSIWRRDLLPTITVQADVVPGIEAKTVNAQLAPALAELQNKLPAGYSIEAGGTVEESAKGLRSIALIFPMMIFLMLTILMVQLQSFQKMFLVIGVAPLGLIGVVMALLPTGTPMGFVAILGIIALSGMIIRNSVILIDMDLARGLHPWDAVIDALSADRADRGRRLSRHDPDRLGSLLGTDGLRDHRRSLCRDPLNPAVLAGALCRLVPHQGATQGTRATSPSGGGCSSAVRGRTENTAHVSSAGRALLDQQAHLGERLGSFQVEFDPAAGRPPEFHGVLGSPPAAPRPVSACGGGHAPRVHLVGRGAAIPRRAGVIVLHALAAPPRRSTPRRPSEGSHQRSS
jgi:hypothetical protein